MSYTYSKIASYTVGSGGVSTVDFLAIPQNYTDLLFKASTRHSATGAANGKLTFNGSSTGYSEKLLYVYPTSASSASATATSIQWATAMNGSNATANTFSNSDIYIPNYTSSNYKSVLTESVAEENGSAPNIWLDAGAWANTSAITSLTFTPSSGSFVQYSTFTLYGIKAEV